MGCQKKLLGQDAGVATSIGSHHYQNGPLQLVLLPLHPLQAQL